MSTEALPKMNSLLSLTVENEAGKPSSCVSYVSQVSIGWELWSSTGLGSYLVGKQSFCGGYLFTYRGTLSVTVIVIGNGLGNRSSNPRQGCLNFT